jgi:ankyrin repeat protein
LKGRTLIIKLLFEKKADVKIRNKEGWTPLNLASKGGYVEIIKLLLKKGADITVASTNG